MKWLKKLFAVEEIDIAPSNLSDRVTEIQTRINTIRHSVEQSEKRPRIKSTEDPPPINNSESTKEQQMMDLKAKLLGKKS
jgi:hypothetical protein